MKHQIKRIDSCSNCESLVGCNFRRKYGIISGGCFTREDLAVQPFGLLGWLPEKQELIRFRQEIVQ
jgi:hypothetical protein